MTAIESRQEMTRSEVAEYLRAFAAQLDPSDDVLEPGATDGDGADRRVTLMVGNDSATINPPETVTFEVEIDSERSLIGSGTEREVEFELAWETEEVESDEQPAELEIK